MALMNVKTQSAWKNKIWNPRKKDADRIIERIYTSSPKDTERFYLRILLCHRKGPKLFEDIRTVDGTVCSTFQEAAERLGYLECDTEWDTCLEEATVNQMPRQLRELFVLITIHCNPSNIANLWLKHKDALSEDYMRDYEVTDQALAYTLRDLDNNFEHHGKSLANFPTLPQLANYEDYLIETNEPIVSRIFQDETSYNRDELNVILDSGENMNAAQKSFFNKVKNNLENQEAKAYFLKGPGGSGKSYLSQILLAYVRSKKKIALAVASCGLAALLLMGGTTAHSRFKIPINISADMNCSVKKGTELAKLLIATDLIIWDECSMVHKHAIEAVDKMLRDITDIDKPFGGKVIVFSGDFKQTLPVILYGVILKFTR